MPNGGPDCCGECAYNRAIQELGAPFGKSESDRREFWARSYCTLRDVKITAPFWTYCANYSHDQPVSLEKEIKGWIFASGLYEGYVRIPWHGHSEPITRIQSTCSICGRAVESGIEVRLADDSFAGFCSNRHYVEWWKTHHDDPSINVDCYASPE